MSSQAQAAKEIRKELKENFKNTKFSVTSEGYAGGDSVNVYWTDGPTTEMVDNIIGKYQYGHFNGMEDIYEYSNKRDIPQSKFVFANRTMSDETRDKIIKKHNEEFCEAGQIKDLNAWNEDARCWNNNLIYRKFNELNMEA